MTTKILIADDEPDVTDLVSQKLKAAGYAVNVVEDGQAAIAAMRSQNPALLILDLMLPGLSGLEVCRIARADPAIARIPIIMLTAKGEEVDRIVGFEVGADDYVTKPFSPRELVLRVRSLLRRAPPDAPVSTSFRAGDITLDPERLEVRVKGKLVELTAMEFKLLLLLLKRRGIVQSRDKLLDEVWGYESAIETRTVDTHVRRLREKLGSAGDSIETVRGFGYRIDSDARR